MNREDCPKYAEIQDRICQAYVIHNYYDQLFTGDEEHFRILNNSGSNFFYFTQKIYIEYLVLCISRLLEPSSQGKNKNLTLEMLVDLAKAENLTDLSSELEDKIEVAKNKSKEIRKYRNRVVSHEDLGTALATRAFPSMELSSIRKSLDAIADIANTFERAYSRHISSDGCATSTAYAWVSSPRGTDAARLVYQLQQVDKATD